MNKTLCRFMAKYHGLTASILMAWANFKISRGKWWRAKADD